MQCSQCVFVMIISVYELHSRPLYRVKEAQLPFSDDHRLVSVEVVFLPQNQSQCFLLTDHCPNHCDKGNSEIAMEAWMPPKQPYPYLDTISIRSYQSASTSGVFSRRHLSRIVGCLKPSLPDTTQFNIEGWNWLVGTSNRRADNSLIVDLMPPRWHSSGRERTLPMLLV